MITQDNLKRRLHYKDGDLIWRNTGRVAGTKNKGYIRISFGDSLHDAHRLVWFYFYGYWPKEIDHIDRNKSNNRIENLREVTHRQNMLNRPTTATRCIYNQNGKFRVRVASTEIGRFLTFEEAVAARDDALNRFNPTTGA